jgi:hypothetical protein
MRLFTRMLLSFKPHAISIFYKCAAVSFPWISPHGVQKIFIVEGSSPKDGAFNGSRPTSLDFLPSCYVIYLQKWWMRREMSFSYFGTTVNNSIAHFSLFFYIAFFCYEGCGRAQVIFVGWSDSLLLLMKICI